MATGLNFQTQTIINSNVDPDSSKVNGKGAENTYLFKFFPKNDKEYKDDTLKIKRDFIFKKSCVKSIRHRAGYPAEMCKATIDFAELMESLAPESGKKNYGRLDIYVEYEGQEPFYGANPTHIRKGIPFWVEFTVTSASAAKLAKDILTQIKKNKLFLIDKDILTATVDGSQLILEGNTEYLRFKEIEIRTFQPYDEYSDVVAEMGDAGVTVNSRGTNSFGTYSQIVKDLRLPTAANYQWSHIRQVETPIVGAIYDQYIIEYTHPSTNDGLQAVGQKLESTTTHVFWVKQDLELQAEWEAALSSIGTIEGCCPDNVEGGELDGE